MARTAGSHSDITGPRIRDAALRLFARHGYAAVSMRQIAADVGLQAGALYNYTPDKQTLLFSLMEGHMTDLLAAWAAEEKGATPRERLRAFTHFHIRFNLDRADAVFISYMELRNLDPENFRRLEGLRRDYERALQTILSDGVADGSFALRDPKIASLAIIAMLTGVNTWYRAGGPLSLPQVQEIYWDMVQNLARA
jgi:AcrR family transcriptional regulator